MYVEFFQYSIPAAGAKSNILVDSNFSARIADFGFTSVLRNHSLSMTITAPTCVGTLLWMAPELFKCSPRPSKASDIYALGMVTFEVRPHRVLRRINSDDRSCRFSRTKYHSHRFPPFLRLYVFSTANDPHGHQIERSSACQTRSGFSRRIAGIRTRPSGQTSQTSCPSSKQLLAVWFPRHQKQLRISVSMV